MPGHENGCAGSSLESPESFTKARDGRYNGNGRNLPMRFAGTETDGRKRRSARTRKAILDAAKTVFLEKGYLKTTFKEISGRAGIGYGTVYSHFTGKEELLRALVDDLMNKVDKVVYINYNPSRRADVYEIVYNQIYTVLALAAENRDSFRIIGDALGHSKKIRLYWDSIFDRFVARTMEDLGYSQAHNLARPLNRRIIAKTLVYAAREFLWDVVWERETDIREITANLIELYIGGAYLPEENS